ncbi:hypothetical protein SDC9_79051 [bioreactor metagenome]|uniref:Uncharacterized protein n=1 Tax=bioreactor metagenome TaxID=1076179 RepID=A0A644YWU1_9ZZZZ
MQGDIIDDDGFVFFVDYRCRTACDTTFAQTAGDDCRVRSHAAARRQDAFRTHHARQIFRGCFAADEDDRQALLLCRFGIGSGEIDMSGSRSWRSAESGRQQLSFIQGFRVERRVEQFVQLAGFDAHDGFFFRDETFAGQINGHRDGCGCCAFPVACLQQVQFAFFDRELDVLHIGVVVLQFFGDCLEFVVDGRHHFLQGVDVQRGADAGHDIFALRVHQEFAEQFFLAGRRVAREGHAGTGIVTAIAEHHALDGDGCAEVMRNIVDFAVKDSPFIVP